MREEAASTALTGALAVALVSGLLGVAGGEGDAAADVVAAPPGIRVATTGQHSERVRKLPIARRQGQRKRVVMSLGPHRLPDLARDDLLRVTAELQVTVNCAFRSPRCVGRIYRYNPRVVARLVLARGPTITGGAGAIPLSGPHRDVCAQRKPHREHHCVLVFRDGGLRIARPGRLPCPLDGCYVNLVAEAFHPRARGRQVMLVGGNRPDGSIPQDRGRIDAIRYRNVAPSDFPVLSTHRRTLTHTPPDFRRRVVISKRLQGLEEGEQLAVEAAMRTGIGHLPYAVRTSTRLILAEGPREARQGQFVKKVAQLNGEIAESNGFNCTQDKGSCLTRKVGVLEMRRDAVRANGRPVPLYVNLVTVFGPKVLKARAGERVRLRRARIRVARFPPQVNR